MTQNENTSLKTLLWGVVIGAAAVTLMNEDSRKKVRSTIKSTLDEGSRKLDKLESATKSQMKDVRSAVTNAKSKARKQLVKKLDQTREKIQE